MIAIVAMLLTWTPVKANGFTFEMPNPPTLTTESVTWPTTGQMTVTAWTSVSTDGDGQIDALSCYQSAIEAPRLTGLLHDRFCDPALQLQYDRTDAASGARECLWLGPGPDGKRRRSMARVVGVGPNVCVLTSSARFGQPTKEPSEGMRRFVDSLKQTGKQTVLAANTPWVTVSGPGCSFQLPKAVAPFVEQQGKVKATVWKLGVPGEQYAVRCTEDPSETVDVLVKTTMNIAASKGITRHDLPGGAVELTFPGSLTRISAKPKGKRVCMVGAASETTELSTDARRFVESFAWTK